MLPGFETYSEKELSNIWTDCIFVTDANFVLNLYRYEAKARDELINIFTSVQDRLWLPNYAAIEFQRNRPKVIADQKKKFSEVKRIVHKMVSQAEGELGKLQLKKRHNLIKTDKFFVDIKSSVAKFLEELDETEKKQIDVYQDFDLRFKINEMFKNKVGPLPNTEWMLELKSEADQRYNLSLPPGFCDIGKGDESDPSFTYAGVTYERKYGDLIIWKQMIDFSKSNKGKNIIFLTDDLKEDWWWIIDSGGEKRIGPRPELIEEMLRLGKSKTFYMYSPEQFLQYAKKYLDSIVSDQTIEEARNVSSQNPESIQYVEDINTAYSAAEYWINANYPHLEEDFSIDGAPDMVLRDSENSEIIGVECIPFRNFRDIESSLLDELEELLEAVNILGLKSLYILLVSTASRSISLATETKIRKLVSAAPSSITFVVGNARRKKDGLIFSEAFSISKAGD